MTKLDEARDDLLVSMAYALQQYCEDSGAAMLKDVLAEDRRIFSVRCQGAREAQREGVADDLGFQRERAEKAEGELSILRQVLTGKQTLVDALQKRVAGLERCDCGREFCTPQCPICDDDS